MNNKKIIIIGGTGSLGQALTRKYQDDNELMIVSRDEHKHVNMTKSDWVRNDIRFKVGDVKDKGSIVSAISEFRPNIIINAAAMKHVPICEDNVYESVKVNIIGHQNVIEATDSAKEDIAALMFISTDKACKPVNVYGMCKAISERLYVDYAQQQEKTKICIVRYGNVLESTGSVIPLFKKLIEDGASNLCVTDEKMTRFLLSLSQASELINWAYHDPQTHGKIVVPKIKSMKVIDIAQCLIDSYQKTNEMGLKIVGVRPGEKMDEELISAEEWTRTDTSLKNYLIGNKKIRDERKSYNSKEALMTGSEIYYFLKENGVVE